MSEGGTDAYFCRAVLLSLSEGPCGRGGVGRNVCIPVGTGEAIPPSAAFLTTTPSASYRVLFLTAEETGCSCPQPGTSAASSATLSQSAVSSTPAALEEEEAQGLSSPAWGLNCG